MMKIGKKLVVMQIKDISYHDCMKHAASFQQTSSSSFPSLLTFHKSSHQTFTVRFSSGCRFIHHCHCHNDYVNMYHNDDLKENIKYLIYLPCSAPHPLILFSALSACWYSLYLGCIVLGIVKGLVSSPHRFYADTPLSSARKFCDKI